MVNNGTDPTNIKQSTIYDIVLLVSGICRVECSRCSNVSADIVLAFFRLKVSGQSAKLALALASTVILGSESRGTHGHIFLSQFSGSLWANRKSLYRSGSGGEWDVEA
jgi:hypothetical protein